MRNPQSVESSLDRCESHNGCSSNVESVTYGDNRNTESALNPPNSVSDFGRRKPFSAPFVYDFWKQVDKSGSCWLWTGKTLKRPTAAYGYMWSPDRKQPIQTHRIAWELAHGPIPAHLKVLHRCDNARCVNPKCLWLGTQLDNMRDMAAKGRRSPDAHSPKGRPWSPEQRRKLTALRQLRAAKQIAARDQKGRSVAS